MDEVDPWALRGLTLREEFKQQRPRLYRFFEGSAGVVFLEIFVKEGPISSYLGLARATVQRKLDHLERVGAVERVGAEYRLGDICAREAEHVPGMINIVVNAAAKLSKLDTR
jgi:hypothetical protein